MSSDICFTSARELARLIRTHEMSAREVMSAFLAQIERLNPKINAIVAKLADDQCLALADQADRQLARGDTVGPLHGLCFAFKELDPVVGFPMTRGSLIFKDFMPSEDSVLAERLRRAGVSPTARRTSPSSVWGRIATMLFMARRAIHTTSPRVPAVRAVAPVRRWGRWPRRQRQRSGGLAAQSG